MGIPYFNLIPLQWKLAAVSALSSCRPPSDFPVRAQRLIVALAADYGNLGDVALTRTLLGFAAIHLPTHRPYLLLASRVYRDLRGVSLAAGPEDVIVIVGGGNMGDLYPDLEEARLQVVKRFPKNRIISFPQSIEFSDSDSGRRALARSRKVYEAHKNLKMYAREAESFAQIQGAFPIADVGLVPDTVLSMTTTPAAVRDIPLMVCLRQDKETRLSQELRDSILDSIRQHCPEAIISDTIVPGSRLDYSSYDHKLSELLELFSRSQCIVTDRLHGLIFSVVTGTPCVVLENSNHKIRSTVDTWLAGHPGLRLLSEPTPAAVLEAIAEVTAIRPLIPDFTEAFKPLAAALHQ